MKLVCRLLDVSDRLLGWCEHEAVALGDGCLRAAGPVTIDLDEFGIATTVSIHWADVNVEVLVPMPARNVSRGDHLTIFQRHGAMIQAGSPPARRLPPVSTKSAVSVGVPVGQLGATGVLL